MPFQSMPYAPPTLYQNRYGNSIAELIARQGEIAGRAAEQKGMLWANAIGNVGQIASGAVQQYQEQKQQSRRDAALSQFIDSGAWQDPKIALVGSVKILGPKDGPQFAEGLIGVAKMNATQNPAEAIKALPMVARGLLAAPDSMKPGLYGSARALMINAKLMTPDQLPEQWSPELEPVVGAIAGQKEEEGFTLSPGAVRFDPSGKQIAAVPAAPKEAPKTLAEIEAEAEARARGSRKGAPPEPRSTEPRPLTQTAEAQIINRLSNQWGVASKATTELSRQVNLMNKGLEAARRGDLAAGSQAVLVTFQKILDPTSVVRESEYARSAAGQSLLSRIQGAAEKLAKGGAGVPVTELEKFAKLATEMTKGQMGHMRAAKERIGKIADRYNIPQELVIENYDYGATLGGAQSEFSVTAPNGKTYTFPNAAEADAFKKRAGIK